MNNTLLINIFRFVILILLQVVLFNNIELFGFITPYPYILFIILYPLNTNKAGLITISFFLGLILDIFNNSGGVHAAACVMLAYFRESFLKISFGVSYEYHMLRITNKISSELITYVAISVILHHIVLLFLEIFSFGFIFEILLRILTSSVFTIIIILIMISLIKPSKK
ncbi:rod shape-determining protein MreD [Myroides ceti]|uniref:Rod shape-determining protein MreD n=1 Tax=Paenimyroides ceti TaxID=395087 RepID=A0ABT8CTL1_9FLAO|nr:rod shape-determining protein MreD [Paenimyroides ceti]MDN3707854.1 rod shape-determining protein MreD [Paenimyroides ceti]MDN3709507.1 rod shape-determining protein MreD [Paenimyroides ceti]